MSAICAPISPKSQPSTCRQSAGSHVSALLPNTPRSFSFSKKPHHEKDNTLRSNYIGDIRFGIRRSVHPPNQPLPPKQRRSRPGSPQPPLLPPANWKNRPTLSAGSGKELGDFKSGIHTMTSAGLERKYTIEIPAHYNKKKPYRLIFAMHMMGGHMDTMVNNQFYGLKTYAERDHVPCIFVAPEGYTDTPPWRGSDDKDHVFFADMLALFKRQVEHRHLACILLRLQLRRDGHLLVGFPKDLRAVACYAPANWNIYLPTNKHEPLAFFSTTGTQDGLCKYVNPMNGNKAENIVGFSDSPRRQRA